MNCTCCIGAGVQTCISLFIKTSQSIKCKCKMHAIPSLFLICLHLVFDPAFSATGGHDGEGLLDSIERYDPVGDIWVVVATLTSPRCLGALVAIKGYLYAVGGYDGTNALQLLQRYNPETKDWTTVTKLPTQRSGFGSAVMDGCLYLVGGCDSLTKVNSVDSYDPEKDQWMSVARMSLRRSGLGAGVTAAFLY